MKCGILTVVLVFATKIKGQDELLVQTTTGPVQGLKTTTPTGKVIDTFYGIPFADPPIGDLRFRRPQPVTPWTEVYSATTKPNACYQLPDKMFGDDFPGATVYDVKTPMKEDCLYLNIWIPTPRPTKSAVLVWIYGGGFQTGSSALDVYDGSILAGEENVIVASMNYRITTLGFFYLGTEKAPGNMGLLDQSLALTWIHDNIANFGGDPDRITVFGESAGSASVSYHLISPLSRNAFTNAIMESGASTAKWGWSSPEKLKKYSLEISEKVGCANGEEDLDLIVECMKQQDPLKLISASVNIDEFMDFGLVPVTDDYFITKHPEQYLSEGDFKKCPILAGSTHEEGTFFMLSLLPQYFPKEEGVTISKKMFHEILPQIEKEFVSVPGEAVAFEYTNWFNDPDKEDYLNPVDKIIGDKYLHCPIDKYANAYSKKENVYMYHFTHRKTPNPWPQWMGVQHGDDLFFLFGMPFIPEENYTPEEVEISQTFMRYWANFARSGNPNMPEEVKIEWPAFRGKKEYLEISSNPTVRTGLRARQCAFWNDYFPRVVNATGLK